MDGVINFKNLLMIHYNILLIQILINNHMNNLLNYLLIY